MQHWERYVSAFHATHGRAPVMYDIICGEGTLGRGAILAGVEVIGFDIAQRPSTYGFKAVSRIGGGGRFERKTLQQMKYVQRDVMDTQFWAGMNNLGHIKGCPAPDIIHASPPCNEFSALRRLSIHESQGLPTAHMLVQTLHHLEE
eukprot:3553523-Pleurochrysis_carterae.AAC.1